MTMPRRFFLYLVLLAASIALLVVLERKGRLPEGQYALDKSYSEIEEGLWMGGNVAVPPPGTQAALNLCQTEDRYEAEHHWWKPIPDREPAPSLEWLKPMVDFVADRRRAGDAVFVHCAAGVSRSGMVVTAYLMAKNHWTRDRALEFVRTKRPTTNPNPAFMELLLEWERKMVDRASRSSASICIHLRFPSFFPRPSRNHAIFTI